MKNKGRRADHIPAGASAKNLETTRDERREIIVLRDKANMTWKVSYLNNLQRLLKLIVLGNR